MWCQLTTHSLLPETLPSRVFQSTITLSLPPECPFSVSFAYFSSSPISGMHQLSVFEILLFLFSLSWWCLPVLWLSVPSLLGRLLTLLYPAQDSPKFHTHISTHVFDASTYIPKWHFDWQIQNQTLISAQHSPSLSFINLSFPVVWCISLGTSLDSYLSLTAHIQSIIRPWHSVIKKA